MAKTKTKQSALPKTTGKTATKPKAPLGIKRMTPERGDKIGDEVKKLALRKGGVTMKEIKEKVGAKHGLSDDQQRKIVRDMVDEGHVRMEGARARTVYRAP